jgi:hypothetical protein
MKKFMIDLINIGILSYNRPIFLRQCIISLEKAGLNKNQIFVFDNGSDNKLMKDSKVEFKNRVQWFGNETNVGYAKNFTRIFSTSNAKYLMALHDDDIIFNNTLPIQLSILEKNSNIDILSCNGFKVNDENVVSNIEILETENKNDLLVFENSSEFASHIFDNSCVPFSPIIFRNSTVKKYALKMVDYEKKYAQCLDAGFLHDMSDKINVALNMKPLYGCRVHENQDSKIMDKTFINIINTEFYYNSIGTDLQIRNLKNKIRKTYTVNFIIDQIKNILNLNIKYFIYLNNTALKELFSKNFLKPTLKRIFKKINE